MSPDVVRGAVNSFFANPVKKTEPREIFSAVIPPVTLNGTAGTRGKNGKIGRAHV